jgi:beta-lactam-binding protein with PASTA domain/tRNA A-37 threonylcarbamoyl transferase component Bud32
MSRMTEQIGRVLGGRYRLLSPLGSGASAQVYLADDVRLRRQVAVKVLHPALADDESFLRRFRAEAQSAASLSHPHLLAVYDWSGDDETPFLVTEYLSGGSLRGMLDAGHRLSPSQALVVGLEAARALDHAHRQGFVHRDIKPANLLFGADGRLHIADFGLARAIAEAGWTETGAVLGTARYASPEQARGEPVDGRSDVYSLALVIIEAVTGQVPFSTDTTIGTLMARLDRSIDVPDALGPLVPVLERAGTIERDKRIDAAEMATGLVGAATDLARPGPLPLAGPTTVSSPDDPRDATLMSRTGLAASAAAAAGAGAAAVAARTPSSGANAARSGPATGASATGAPATGAAPTAGARAGAAAVGSEATQVVTEIDPAATNVLAVPPEGLPVHRPAGPPGRRPYEPADGLSRGDRSTRRLMLGAAVVLLAAALGVIGGWSYMQSQVPSHTVPESLVGMQRRDVAGAVRDFGWEVEYEETREDGTAPGQVLATRPEGGESLKENKTLTVVVSLGATLVPLPDDLVGMTDDEARTALEEAGLVAALISQPSDEVEEGIVTGFVDGEPPDEVAKGSTVSLFVSSGPEFTVPDLAGEPYADAVAELEAMELEVESRDEQNDEREPGQVIRTEPAAGQEVEPGDTVLVVVAVDQVEVPDVSGDKLDQATEAIEDAGLTVGTVVGPEDGRVWTTWPFAGDEVESGSTVDLVLRPGR